MALRITNIESDLAKLNKELARMDTLERRLAKANVQQEQTTASLKQLVSRRPGISQNNLIFTFDGANTMSWGAGWVRDLANRYYPIPAGSRAGLTAGTFYWVSWNPTHQTMVFSLTKESLLDVKENLFVGSASTGASGQAGGGGTAGGSVTSVAQTVPPEFTITGSPITQTGTLAIGKANETANTVWAGPTSGAAAAPTFRGLIQIDLPATANPLNELWFYGTG